MSVRTDRNTVAIKRTIDQNYDKFKYLGVFTSERNEVMKKILEGTDEEIAKIADECREGGVRWRMFPRYLNKIETELLGGAEVCDFSTKEEKGLETVCGTPVSEFITVVTKADGVSVKFSTTGVYDCLIKANRNGRFSVRGMSVTPDTEFTVVNELTAFWEDRYSLALSDEKVRFAISAEDSKQGKKGVSAIKLYVLENGRLVIDDLGKYIDTTELLRWINA